MGYPPEPVTIKLPLTTLTDTTEGGITSGADGEPKTVISLYPLKPFGSPGEAGVVKSKCSAVTFEARAPLAGVIVERVMQYHEFGLAGRVFTCPKLTQFVLATVE